MVGLQYKMEKEERTGLRRTQLARCTGDYTFRVTVTSSEMNINTLDLFPVLLSYYIIRCLSLEVS
jgi:hypothetical protein